MTTDILTPATAPSYEMEVTTTATVRVAQFGDGYRQRSATLNNVAQQARLTWNAYPLADADALIAKFVGWRGVDSFFYTIPGEISPRKWTCAEWSYRWDGPDTKNIQATLKEEFDPT